MPSSSTTISYKTIANILFTAAILAGAFVVLHSFILAILWAAVLFTATWPLHQRIVNRWGRRAATISTALMFVFLVGPMAGVLILLGGDLYNIGNYLLEIDTYGRSVPGLLYQIPYLGEYPIRFWEKYLLRPGQLSALLLNQLDVLRSLGQNLFFDLLSRLATLAFALWALYFFYRDGAGVTAWVNRMGYRWLPRRWSLYAVNLPVTLRVVVNGIVIVGFIEAILLALLLWSCGVPAPVTLGVILAVVAFIPLAAPLLLAIIAILLFANQSHIASITVFILGNGLILLADYLVRPRLIQSKTDLPFLAILFGIFGGVGSMGIVGLIIGPVLLVLLLELLRESAIPDPEYTSLDLTRDDLNKE